MATAKAQGQGQGQRAGTNGSCWARGMYGIPTVKAIRIGERWWRQIALRNQAMDGRRGEYKQGEAERRDVGTI